VLSDEVFQDGKKTMKHLLSLSSVEIENRKEILKMFSPILQWGWKGKYDVLPLAFASVMTSPETFI
jgi:hypothetical protein